MKTPGILLLNEVLDKTDMVKYTGRVSKVVGLTIESEGPEVTIGELCEINELAGRLGQGRRSRFQGKQGLADAPWGHGGIDRSKVVAMNRSFQVA